MSKTQPPKTPTTPSIRNFVRRTSVTPTTLASTYRRNSRCPIDIDTPPSPSTSSRNGNTTTTAIVNDIATHLKNNSGTPTKPKHFATKTPMNMGFRTPLRKTKEEVEKELETFTPLHPLPSSVTIRKRRESSPPAGRPNANSLESVNLHDGKFPSIEASVEQMPHHPVYKFRRTSSSIFNRQSQKDIKTPDTPSPIFHSPNPNASSPDLDTTSNKENIDPVTLTPSSSRNIRMFDTPPPPPNARSQQILPYNWSRQKGIFERKKLEGMRNTPPSGYTSGVEFSTSSRFVMSYNPGWGIPSNLKEPARPFPIPSKERHPSLSTPTSSQPRSTFPPPKTGLTSKLGLLNHKYPSVNPKTPLPIPRTPQKLLHRSAKSTCHNRNHNYNCLPSPSPSQPSSLSHRNAKKPEDLKTRFPRRTYHLGTGKHGELVKIARSASSRKDIDGEEMFEGCEWSELDIQTIDGEKGRGYGHADGAGMVDVGWGVC